MRSDSTTLAKESCSAILASSAFSFSAMSCASSLRFTICCSKSDNRSCASLMSTDFSFRSPISLRTITAFDSAKASSAFFCASSASLRPFPAAFSASFAFSNASDLSVKSDRRTESLASDSRIYSRPLSMTPMFPAMVCSFSRTGCEGASFSNSASTEAFSPASLFSSSLRKANPPFTDRYLSDNPEILVLASAAAASSLLWFSRFPRTASVVLNEAARFSSATYSSVLTNASLSATALESDSIVTFNLASCFSQSTFLPHSFLAARADSASASLSSFSLSFWSFSSSERILISRILSSASAEAFSFRLVISKTLAPIFV